MSHGEGCGKDAEDKEGLRRRLVLDVIGHRILRRTAPYHEQQPTEPCQKVCGPYASHEMICTALTQRPSSDSLGPRSTCTNEICEKICGSTSPKRTAAYTGSPMA